MEGRVRAQALARALITRRSFLGGVAGTAAAAALAGCGLGPSGGAGQGTAATPGKGPVTLTWYIRWTQLRINTIAKPMIADFRKSHPNVTIEIANLHSGSAYWDKLQTQIAAGNPPDVIYPSTTQAYTLATKGALTNLSPYIERDHVDTSKFEGSVLDDYKYKGKLYGVPADVARYAVFYNKDLFHAAGRPFPSKGWSWDDLFDTARAMTRTSGGQPVYGIDNFAGTSAGVGYWPLVVWAYTKHNLFDDDHHPRKFLLNDPVALKWVQKVADLIVKDRAMPGPEQTSSVADFFVAGKAAMKIQGHWMEPQYQANGRFAWDLARLPAGKVSVNNRTGSGWAIPAGSKHPAEAWEWVKYLAAPGAAGTKAQLKLEALTPPIPEEQRSPAFLAPPPGMKSVDQAAFLAGSSHLFAMGQPIAPSYSKIADILANGLVPAWEGKQTIADAVRKLTPDIDDVLQNGS